MKIKGLNDTQCKILTDYMIKYFGDGPDGEEFSEIKKFDDVVEFIMCSGSHTEKLDSNYLTTTYFVKVKDLKFCIDYSQYRKDGGLCDGDWGTEIYVLKSKKKPVKKSVKK